MEETRLRYQVRTKGEKHPHLIWVLHSESCSLVTGRQTSCFNRGTYEYVHYQEVNWEDYDFNWFVGNDDSAIWHTWEINQKVQ